MHCSFQAKQAIHVPPVSIVIMLSKQHCVAADVLRNCLFKRHQSRTYVRHTVLLPVCVGYEPYTRHGHQQLINLTSRVISEHAHTVFDELSDYADVVAPNCDVDVINCTENYL